MDVESLTHINTLSVAPLELDFCLSERLKAHPDWENLFLSLIHETEAILSRLLQRYLQEAEAQKIPEALGLASLNEAIAVGKTWEVTLCFTDNEEIQSLNHQYRNKNTATDVLSFTLLADSDIKAVMVTLPVVQLGDIFISLEWALEHAQEEIQKRHSDCHDLTCSVLIEYILERIVHGLLHLMGVNHDTDEDYNRVVAIQRRILDDTYRFKQV